MRVARVLLWILALTFLVPALSLTLLRPTDTTIGPVVRWQAFAPLAIPLYVVVLVVSITGLLVDGRSRRLAHHGGWSSSSPVGSTSAWR